MQTGYWQERSHRFPEHTVAIATTVGNSGGKCASVVAVMTIGNNNTLDIDVVANNRGVASDRKVAVLEKTSG